MSYILFNADMLEKILSGRKIQTRRPVKAPVCCYGKPGDKLKIFKWDHMVQAMRSNNPDLFNKVMEVKDPEFEIELVSVRSEPLRMIHYHDCEKEGFRHLTPQRNLAMFLEYWDSIYTATPFESTFNPEVWVIEFKVVKTA